MSEDVNALETEQNGHAGELRRAFSEIADRQAAREREDQRRDAMTMDELLAEIKKGQQEMRQLQIIGDIIELLPKALAPYGLRVKFTESCEGDTQFTITAA